MRTFQRSQEESGALPATRLETRSGAVVTVTAEERIEVRNPEGRLIVEVDPLTGRTTVSAPGDLCFTAPSGDLELRTSRVLRLDARQLEVNAVEGRVGIRNLAFGGAKLRAKLEQARIEMGRLETVADRIIERTRSVFRQADDLYELQAGRVRELVKGGYSVRSKHASVIADEEVKIDGKQILLG